MNRYVNLKSIFPWLFGSFLALWISFCHLQNPISIHTNFDPGEHEWYLRNHEDSVDLYILEYGRGDDTVLVIHGGFGAEHSYLREAFEGLYDRFHFIFYDQRGSLRSPCPIEKISVDHHISDIEAIRKEFGIKRLNLFGHSNGSTLGVLYLSQYPNHVGTMVVTASVQLEYPLIDTLCASKKCS